jgi:hypothetical protein
VHLPDTYHSATYGWQRNSEDAYVMWFRDVEVRLLIAEGEPHFMVPLRPLIGDDDLRVISLVDSLNDRYPDRSHGVMETGDGWVILTPAELPADSTDLTIAAGGFAISVKAAVERRA